MAINGREYDYADVTVLVGGADQISLRGIKYSEKAEKEAVFGKGRYAKSIQTGNVMVEGELTLLQSGLEALIAAGNGTILGLSVDVLVNYGNQPDPLVTDRIEGVQFTSSEKALKQGDKFMEVTIPFVALKVVHNI